MSDRRYVTYRDTTWLHIRFWFYVMPMVTDISHDLRTTHVVFTLFVFAFVQTNRIKKVDSSVKNYFINYNVVVNKIRPAVLLLHKRGIA
jgi:hypothetical protein